MAGDVNSAGPPESGDRTPTTEGMAPVLPAAVRPSGPSTATFPAEPGVGAPGDPTALGSAPELPGQSGGLKQAPVLTGYTAVRKLGEGTYGQVWLYEENRTGIRVAIKFFSRCWGLEWQLLQAEVKQLALLHADPGIVQLLDVEPHADPPYYVMSYAPGGSLQTRLHDGRAIPLAEATVIIRQVTEAMAYVHAKGVRHCDLKPGNVLLDARGRALLADFGQAHLASDVSPALGTFFYMAPEQAVLEEVIPDTRWDVYGLGALFYAMLTGQPPRQSSELATDLAHTRHIATRLERYRDGVRRAPAPRAHRLVPGVDHALAAIIDRCLEIDPARRFRDAGALLEALERRDRIQRRRPLLLVGLAVPLLLVLLLTGLTYRNGLAQIRLAERHLADQLQESDRVSARLVANVVQDHLHDRIEFLARFVEAHRTGLLRVRDGRAARPALLPLLQQLSETAEHRNFFRQVSIADARGYILAGYPTATDEILGDDGKPRCFAFRDWFNGRGDQLGDPSASHAPIRAIHLSQPYESKTPGNPLAVNLSVPVRDDADAVAGVVTVMVPIHTLHAWLTGVEIPQGQVTLFNERGQCLKHAFMDRIKATSERNPTDWRTSCDLYRRALRNPSTDGLTPAYVDPIDEKEYLAGYARFTRQPGRLPLGWLVVVQHERSLLLAPVTALRANLLWHCLMGLTLGSAMIVAVWMLLMAAVRRDILGLRG